MVRLRSSSSPCSTPRGDKLGEEDTKEDKSSDADDKRESQGLDDEGHGLGDEDHGLDDESQGLKDEGLGLEEEEAIPEGQQSELLVYAGAAGSREVSPSSPVVPSPIALPVATPTATILVDEDQFIEECKGAIYRSGAVRDEIFSERYRFRNLEREQERATLTFRALWMPMLALEAWRELQEMRGRVTALELERSRREL
ncbi:hypothetical protein Tco_1264523 [Tanacetum coccineum]